MNNITPLELKKKIDAHEPFQLIDVREKVEHEHFNIGGILIPLGEIMEHTNTFEKTIPVVFYCKMGIRSQIAIQRLNEKFGYSNLVNLQGGVERWKKEIKKNS
jgi:adenylyltransferase/sulfurtransferase